MPDPTLDDEYKRAVISAEAARAKNEHARAKSRQAGAIGCAVIILLILGITLIANTSDTTPKSDLPPNAITDQKYTEAVRSLIVAQGYECPKINVLLFQGDSPYGTKLQALCDPINGTVGSLNYQVYPQRFIVNVCKPWGILDNGCD